MRSFANAQDDEAVMRYFANAQADEAVMTTLVIRSNDK